MEASTARTVIKVVSVLSFICVLVSLCFAAVFMFAGSYVAAGGFPETGSNAPVVTVTYGLLAISMFVWAVYHLLTGIGLWRVRPWARVLLLIEAWIVFACSILIVFGNLVAGDSTSSLLGLALFFISGSVLCLFQFTDAVREQFGSIATAVPTPVAAQPAETMMLTPETVAVEPAAAVAAVEAVVGVTVAKPRVAPAKKKPAKKPAKKAAKKVAKRRR